MNGCHKDAGHQGQQSMMYQLQDQFWWPCMATQMQKAISNCKQCIQHGRTHAKAPTQPIIVTTPLELQHIDFMSIEMTMELDQPPNVVNILVFCNHFMKHVMVYMTHDQTVKTVANTVINTLHETSWHPPCMGPHTIFTLPNGKNPTLKANLNPYMGENWSEPSFLV